VAATVLAAGSLIFSLTIVEPPKLVPFALFAAGGLVVSVTFGARPWAKPIAATVGLALLAAGAVLLVKPDVVRPPAVVVTASASPTPFTHNIVITEPEPGDSVPVCISVEGTGDIPAGHGLWALVGAQSDDGRPTFYLVQKAHPTTEKRWTVRVSVGQEHTTGPGYTIHVVLVDRAVDEYLTNRNPQAEWWSRVLPPNAVRVAGPIAVNRAADPGSASCP